MIMQVGGVKLQFLAKEDCIHDIVELVLWLDNDFIIAITK